MNVTNFSFSIKRRALLSAQETSIVVSIAADWIFVIASIIYIGFTLDIPSWKLCIYGIALYFFGSVIRTIIYFSLRKVLYRLNIKRESRKT